MEQVPDVPQTVGIPTCRQIGEKSLAGPKAHPFGPGPQPKGAAPPFHHMRKTASPRGFAASHREMTDLDAARQVRDGANGVLS